MRVILASKDCARIGVMKGCPCVVHEIVFAPHEALPDRPTCGNVYMLQYLPVSLLLKVDNADWKLPNSDLPSGLPKNLERRGLFQVCPTFDYLSVKTDTDYMRVRRSTFKLLPADTITAYTAQGGTFDAVVLDMQRPPSGSGVGLAQHWLACYVMLSRATSLDGLLILRPAKREELETRPPQYLLDELERLAALETSSMPELLDYIFSLSLDIPEVIREVLAPDAVDKEQRIVSATRAALRATEFKGPAHVVPGDESSNASLGGNAVHLETTSVHRPVPNALPGVKKRGHEPAPDEQPPGAKRYRLTKKTAQHRSSGCFCEPPESTSGMDWLERLWLP